MKKTVESVTQGHPDKVCDQIADAIVDEYLRRDKQARVDINVLGSHGMMMIGGEVTSTADFDLGALAKQVYAEIGYKDDMEVFVNIDTQSAEMKRVHNGVTDNVVVNGFATNETRELLPRALVYAHNLARRLDDLRKTDPAFSWLKPDGKIQLTMDGDHVCGVTVLASHHVSIDEKEVKTALLERLLVPILGENGVVMYINPIGTFIDAGFKADSGASGRKLTVDTYGGLIPQGDKSISGKDPSRVDRAGAYMARFAARYLVEQGLATSAMVSLVYSMGRAEPVHLHATGMGEKSRGAKMDLSELLKKMFDFRPEAIVERLHLIQPVYRATASYGHFGRTGFPWEEATI
ncbi:methionine adenosyltransferase [Patescibacteria group bacterium]|nr:MAG: methionine adenosyltransferase [Patescibacteria group bacterium]